MLGKKAQVGAIGGVFLFIIFNILYFIFAAGFIADSMKAVVASQNMSGVEAFILTYFNLWIVLIEFVAIMVYSYISN